MDDLPEDLQAIIHADAIGIVSAFVTTATMAMTESMGLGWNPFFVYMAVVGWLSVQAIIVHKVKRKG